MKRLLVCSILRNSRPHLDRWFGQLLRLQSLCADEWEMCLSVYENDSIDGTAECLVSLSKNAHAFMGKVIVGSEKLGTPHYSSIWHPDRMRNLAMARQKCLDQANAKWGLDSFQKVAYIEPDVAYDPIWCFELILARHLTVASIGDPDIYSGWSLRSEIHPKESVYLYDTCATRQTDRDTCWDFFKQQTWKDESLIKTHLNHFNSNCLHKVWSTFNCFCVYKMEPFLRGARWGWVNTRLNTGQQYINDGDNGSGWCEADTVCICERFRAMGYNGIYLNTNCLIRHLT